MNPYSIDMMKTYYAFKALNGLDVNCVEYIREADRFAVQPATVNNKSEKTSEVFASELQRAIIKGLKDRAGEMTKELLAITEPLTVVNDEIIPALNTVGRGYEEKTVYLPQLLMSAEAAKSAFEAIKASMPAAAPADANGVIVIATVQGDIHDIGKNIVKLLLENYGFHVVDLGKDVAPHTILEKVVELHAPIVGLSALMTTTVPAMKETLDLIKEKAPWCKTIVGGAVLTQDYADKIGADKYAKDAMEAVRYAQMILRS